MTFSENFKLALNTATPTFVVGAVTAAITSKPAVDFFNKIPKINEHIVKLLPQGEFTLGVNCNAVGGVFLIHAVYTGIMKLVQLAEKKYEKEWLTKALRKEVQHEPGQPAVLSELKIVPYVNKIAVVEPLSAKLIIRPSSFVASSLLVVTVGSAVINGYGALQLVETLKRSAVYGANTLLAVGSGVALKFIYDKVMADRNQEIENEIKEATREYTHAIQLDKDDAAAKAKDSKGAQLNANLNSAKDKVASANNASEVKAGELQIPTLREEIAVAAEALTNNKDDQKTQTLREDKSRNKTALKQALENPEYVKLLADAKLANEAVEKAQKAFELYTKPKETLTNLATAKLKALVELQKEQVTLDKKFAEAKAIK